MTRHRPHVLFPDAESPEAQERLVAREVRGHRQAGSGASKYAKGDVLADHFLIECKRTVHASLSIKKSWLDKISAEAAAAGKEPALAIEIAGGSNSAHGERDWVAVPLRVWKKIIGEAG
jgi:Holliday junction resolvase